MVDGLWLMGGSAWFLVLSAWCPPEADPPMAGLVFGVPVWHVGAPLADARDGGKKMNGRAG
jgi:hypothetical protein